MVKALDEVVGVSLKPVLLFNQMFESRGYSMWGVIADALLG